MLFCTKAEAINKQTNTENEKKMCQGYSMREYEQELRVAPAQGPKSRAQSHCLWIQQVKTVQMGTESPFTRARNRVK